MRYFLISALSILMTANFVFAQADDEYEKNEFYVGFVGSFIDGRFSDDNFAGGVQTSYVRNLHRFIGLKGDVSVVQKSDRIALDLDGFIVDDDVLFVRRTRLRVNTFMGGVEVKDNESNSKVKPFAHALAGVGHVTARSRCESGDCTLFPNQPRFSETGFSAAFGGGLDIKLGKKITLRAIQADYNPIRIDGFTVNNYRVGVGIVLKP